MTGRRAAASRAASVDERVAALLAELEAMGSEKDRAGMARYGIKVDDAFGVSIYELRRMAKPLRRDHELALALWATGNHEARLLATIVDDPALVDEAQMEALGRSTSTRGTSATSSPRTCSTRRPSPTRRRTSGRRATRSSSGAPPSP